ncbi:MAG: twin-arginine translocation signal domain-containing protein, partial [Planctomycetes bacterium]|nr:twin-arginine translocation signal domain-containing protein [Planctomycetota bacterium]
MKDIKRRDFLKMAAMGALAGMSGVSLGAGKATKPNFVFIIADDCTFRD